jgi:hypothetical protein
MLCRIALESHGVAPVDCLTVVPLGGGQNHATILWHVTRSDNAGEVGQYRLFEMCDVGEPTGGVPPDAFYDWGDTNNDCGPRPLAF